MNPSPVLPATRRVRFVCISDTHNSPVKLPKGDVLVHAGDLTNQGSHGELVRAVAWLEKTDFQCKVVVAGNHDITLDEDFYNQHAAKFHNQISQSPQECRTLLERSPTITYLCHEATTISLKGKDGMCTHLKVFGSPYSPRNGTWAFSYDQEDGDNISPSVGITTDRSRRASAGEGLWSDIPGDTDVIVTHTPPYQHCDWSAERNRAMGCKGLQQALRRVRPRLSVCGHVHEGRGAEWVRWNSEDGAIVERWDDPGSGKGNKKISLISPTARAGKQSLKASGVAAGGNGGGWDTCIVNGAIAATNYPHIGGKRFNKPIVVDLELPVWRESTE